MSINNAQNPITNFYIMLNYAPGHPQAEFPRLMPAKGSSLSGSFRP